MRRDPSGGLVTTPEWSSGSAPLQSTFRQKPFNRSQVTASQLQLLLRVQPAP